MEGLEARRSWRVSRNTRSPSGPAPGNGLFGITGGPDGNVYFTDTLNNAIGQITPSGAITELPLSGPVAGGFFKNGLDGITLGSDDKLAFTESAQGAIGKITTTGSYNQYPIDSTGNRDRPGTRPDHDRERRYALVDRGWGERDRRADARRRFPRIRRSRRHERWHHRPQHERYHRRI